MNCADGFTTDDSTSEDDGSRAIPSFIDQTLDLIDEQEEEDQEGDVEYSELAEEAGDSENRLIVVDEIEQRFDRRKHQNIHQHIRKVGEDTPRQLRIDLMSPSIGSSNRGASSAGRNRPPRHQKSPRQCFVAGTGILPRKRLKKSQLAQESK